MAIRKKTPIKKATKKPLKKAPTGNSNVAPPTGTPPPAAPQMPWGERARRLGESLGQNSGQIGRNIGAFATQGPLGVVEGLGQGLGGSFGPAGAAIGGNVAKFGALGTLGTYLADPVFNMGSRMLESNSEKKTRVHTEEEKKYRSKMYDQIMGGRTDSFEETDLDNADQQQDAGWRGAFDKVDYAKYSKVASESIKNNDPATVWNMMVRQAQANGKKINTSKPLYLPNTFTKNGQKYAYAIDASQRDEKTNAPKLRYIPIKIGGKPFEEEETK